MFHCSTNPSLLLSHTDVGRGVVCTCLHSILARNTRTYGGEVSGLFLDQNIAEVIFCVQTRLRSWPWYFLASTFVEMISFVLQGNPDFAFQFPSSRRISYSFAVLNFPNLWKVLIEFISQYLWVLMCRKIILTFFLGRILLIVEKRNTWFSKSHGCVPSHHLEYPPSMIPTCDHHHLASFSYVPKCNGWPKQVWKNCSCAT